MPDAENFEDYRGLYFGFDKLPGPAVSTPEKLGELLKDLPGVAVSCKEKYEKAREQICPRDDGKACKRIPEVLLYLSDSDISDLPVLDRKSVV